MRALFRHAPVFEYHHMVGVGCIRHAVRHHDHGFAAIGKRMNGLQNQGFAFHIDAAGGFVENVDGRLPQQCARNGDALFLAARQVACTLFDGQVKFLRLRTHEIADMRRFQRLPQFAFGGIRLGHQQIVTQRSCKKVALRRHYGDFPRKGFDGKIVDLVPLRRVVSCVSGLQPHTSFISGKISGEQFDGGGFTGSGGTDDGGHLPAPRSERDAMQCDDRTIIIFRHACFSSTNHTGLSPDLSSFSSFHIRRHSRIRSHTHSRRSVRIHVHISERHVIKAHVHTVIGSAEFRHFLHPMRRNRRIKQCENTLGRSHAVHRDMEERPQLAQRNEEIRGKKHYQQHAGKRQCGTTRILPDRYAHAGRGTPVCDDVHGGERAQLNLQNIHGHYAELFRLLAHFLGGMRIRVKSFQRFKTLYIVKKHRSHVGVFSPIFFEYSGCAHCDHANNQYNQRRAYKQCNSRRHINRRNYKK